MFHIKVNGYNVLFFALHKNVLKQVTKCRLSLQQEKILAAFLIHTGYVIFAEAARGLEVCLNAVLRAVRQVLHLIGYRFKSKIFFFTDLSSASRAMGKFKKIAGMPHCVCAIDGIHMPCFSCLMEQH